MNESPMLSFTDRIDDGSIIDVIRMHPGGCSASIIVNALREDPSESDRKRVYRRLDSLIRYRIVSREPYTNEGQGPAVVYLYREADNLEREICKGTGEIREVR